jgi:hypothetical protein
MGQIKQQYPTSISHLCARWLVSASASLFLSPLTHSRARWLFLAPEGLHLSPQAPIVLRSSRAQSPRDRVYRMRRGELEEL